MKWSNDQAASKKPKYTCSRVCYELFKVYIRNVCNRVVLQCYGHGVAAPGDWDILETNPAISQASTVVYSESAVSMADLSFGSIWEGGGPLGGKPTLKENKNPGTWPKNLVHEPDGFWVMYTTVFANKRSMGINVYLPHCEGNSCDEKLLLLLLNAQLGIHWST